MGEFILKASREDDLWLIWSTITDSPHWVFESEVEILKHLWAEYRRSHPDCEPRTGTGPAARLARALRTGTSMIAPDIGTWDDEALPVREAEHWYELPRANLVAYAKALLADDEAAAHALLVRQEIDNA